MLSLLVLSNVRTHTFMLKYLRKVFRRSLQGDQREAGSGHALTLSLSESPQSRIGDS